jgi:hypothetical protein
MLGPVFVREVSLAPKRPKFYLARTVFALSLLMLVCTGYLVVAGTQPLRSVSDLARFGGWMFQLLSPLQLVVLVFLAAIGATSTVSIEKDRRTLVLVLLTRITGGELVIGKLVAGMIGPVTMLMSALPVFLMLTLMGGVSIAQVLAVAAVSFAASLTAASLGVTVGFWREKTFQAVAVTVLAIVLWLAFCEMIAAGVVPGISASVAQWASPINALRVAAAPMVSSESGGLPTVVAMHLLLSFTASAALCLFTAIQVRKWNPSREARLVAAGGEETDERTASWKIREPRSVWNNPVLWREVRTWAYGRKVMFVRFAYLLLFTITAVAVWQASKVPVRTITIEGTIPPTALIVTPLMVVSLVIVNALAVSSVVTERDVLALDLLLVSDMSPREFIFGKLWGVLYVAKDIWGLPLLLLFGCWRLGMITGEELIFCYIGAVTLYIFATMLGLHCGLNYSSGRAATLTSLGTIFFQCLGVATCMVIMTGFRGSFGLQLAPFLAVIVGGGAGIYAALGWRRPSTALLSASFGLPFLTFYAITAFLLRLPLPVMLAVVFAYGFASLAILIPAISEFDVAMGRTRGGGDESA